MSLIAALSLLIAPLHAEQPDNPVLCTDLNIARDANGVFFEEELTAEKAQFSLNTLRNEIPAWVERGAQNGEPFSWETSMAYSNHLNSIKGYILKLEALSAANESKEEAIEKFCTFLEDTVRID